MKYFALVKKTYNITYELGRQFYRLRLSASDIGHACARRSSSPPGRDIPVLMIRRTIIIAHDQLVTL